MEVASGPEFKDIRKFIIPWQKCSICHQTYQHELAIDLANALLQFMDEKFLEKNLYNQMRYTDALRIKVEAIRTMETQETSDFRAEGIKTA